MSSIENEKMEQTTVETPDALKLIGNLAVRFHMINDEQLQQALLEQGKHQPRSPVGQTLVEMGLLSESQLEFLIGAQRMKALRTKDIKFGRIAVENGFVTESQVEAVLQRQKQEFIKNKKATLIGDILVADGTMSEAQKQSVIEAQQRILKAREEYATLEAGVVEEKKLTGAEGVELIISKDGLKASLSAAPSVEPDALRRRVEELLQEYAVSFGLSPEGERNAWINEGELREQYFVVARGIAPVPGHGGKINYHFDTDPLKAGKIKEGDVIDFKDRGEIPQLDEGAILAELSEPDPGVAGTNVHDEVIPAPAVKNTILLCGSGAVLSGDGRTATAELSGSPSIAKSGALSVFPLFKVDGNIGYKTGHVNFDGDIQVSGTVEKDFNVNGGKLTANEIEAARIVVKGDLVISGGIMGAHIKAGGNVMAAYIHDSIIEVDGDLLVKKEIMGCDIRAGGGVYSKSSIILDSRIAARAGIVAGDIGSEVSGPSNLQVGSDALLEFRIAELNDVIHQRQQQQTEIRQQIEQGEKDNQQINTDIAELAQIQDRSQVEHRELAAQREALIAQGEPQQAEAIAQQIAASEERAKKAEQDLNALFDQQDALASQIPQLEQQIMDLEEQNHFSTLEREAMERQIAEEQTDVYIKVNGTIYPMTTVSTAHASVKTKQSMKALIIREKAKRLETGDVVWKIVTESLK